MTQGRRELTGKWYLEKGFINYRVKVEVIRTTICEYDLSESPEFKLYEAARPEDLIALEIKVA